MPGTLDSSRARMQMVIIPGGFLLLALVLTGGFAFLRSNVRPRNIKSAGEIMAPSPRTRVPAVVSLVDSEDDGIPDSARLRSFADRDNFRQWFTGIAETQFYNLTNEWNPDQRDCAGLVRFAWREALKTHDRAWFQSMGPGYELFAPDVKAYRSNSGNPLGSRIFRTASGSFQAEDLGNGKFSEFADARTIKEFNSVFLGRDRRQAEAGDLLFFYQPWVQKQPFHVMIFLGTAHFTPGGASDWVVYHTGATPLDSGSVKKVRLATLDQHPDRRWRPIESNRNFIGFFRLKILD